MTQLPTNKATDQQNQLMQLRPSIDSLAAQWEAAKQAENTAKEKRLRIEDMILENCGCVEEGATSFDGSFYKITTTGKVSRNVDINAVDAMYANLPEAARDCFKFKASINKKALDKLEKTMPKTHAMVSQCFAESAGKPSVTIKRLQPEE